MPETCGRANVPVCISPANLVGVTGAIHLAVARTDGRNCIIVRVRDE